MYVHIAGGTAEVQTQTPAHRNLIGRIVDAPQPVLSPSSILQPCSSHQTFILVREDMSSYVFKKHEKINYYYYSNIFVYVT